MDFKLFFKEKAITILLLLFGIITIEIFLMAYNVGMFIKIYIPLIIMGLYMISIIIEYFKRKKFYDNLLKMLEELDEKYLITEIIKTPNFLEGQIFKNSLEQIDKSMLENVNKYKYMTEDYKEYIELWIHEIKIPISASKMVIENNKNAITKSIDEELDKVENYIEQALFYARSNTVEKDYYIRKVFLKDIIAQSPEKEYGQLYADIMLELSQGTLAPVRSAGTNGKKPALPVAFWEYVKEPDYGDVSEKLDFKLHPLLHTTYYRKQLRIQILKNVYN